MVQCPVCHSGETECVAGNVVQCGICKKVFPVPSKNTCQDKPSPAEDVKKPHRPVLEKLSDIYVKGVSRLMALDKLRNYIYETNDPFLDELITDLIGEDDE